MVALNELHAPIGQECARSSSFSPARLSFRGRLKQHRGCTVSSRAQRGSTQAAPAAPSPGSEIVVALPTLLSSDYAQTVKWTEPAMGEFHPGTMRELVKQLMPNGGNIVFQKVPGTFGIKRHS